MDRAQEEKTMEESTNDVTRLEVVLTEKPDKETNCGHKVNTENLKHHIQETFKVDSYGPAIYPECFFKGTRRPVCPKCRGDLSFDFLNLLFGKKINRVSFKQAERQWKERQSQRVSHEGYCGVKKKKIKKPRVDATSQSNYCVIF